MNILLMRFGAVVESEGGTEKVSCNMANEFVKRGHDMTIICCEKKQGKPFFPLSEKVEFINLNDTGKEIKGHTWLRIKRELLKAIGKLDRTAKDKIFIESRYDNSYIKNRFNKIIETTKPDIIIAYDYLAVLFLKYIMKNNLPTIAMLHNDASTYFNDNASKLQISAYNNVECIQLLDKHKVELVKKYCPDCKVVYIPNTIENIEDGNKKIYEKKLKKIIHVGALVENNKRQHIIIEAFNKIKAVDSEWTIEFIGGTKTDEAKLYKEKMLKYIKDNNLEKNINFSGISNNVMQKLMESNIFVFPSLSEGMPLALIEAMSVGLPAIGYKSCPSVNELIIDGYNGFLCDDGIDDFAEKMKILMQDEQLRKMMGENARESMKQFTPEKIWNQWEFLIKEVIKTTNN